MHHQNKVKLNYFVPTCVWALRVLYAAEILLGANADTVVLIGQVQPACRFVIKGHYLACNSCEILQAPVFGWKVENLYTRIYT